MLLHLAQRTHDSDDEVRPDFGIVGVQLPVGQCPDSNIDRRDRLRGIPQCLSAEPGKLSCGEVAGTNVWTLRLDGIDGHGVIEHGDGRVDMNKLGPVSGNTAFKVEDDASDFRTLGDEALDDVLHDMVPILRPVSYDGLERFGNGCLVAFAT